MIQMMLLVVALCIGSPILVYICMRMGTLGYLHGHERFKEIQRRRQEIQNERHSHHG